jgi:hypothetical protein
LSGRHQTQEEDTDGYFRIEHEAFQTRFGTSPRLIDTILSEAQVNQICEASGHVWRNCYWRPAVILVTFLPQILWPDR